MPLFGSYMPYVTMKKIPGKPLIALRTDEKHFKNIQVTNKVSFLIFPHLPQNKSTSDFPLAKLNMTAKCSLIDDDSYIGPIIDKFGLFFYLIVKKT